MPKIISTDNFQKTIWDYYRNHGRVLPWRYEKDPYKVFVSEVMLQQTQVARVLTKYPQFIAKFPSVKHLAQSSFSDILPVWQGMGYNRRAKYLLQTAQMINDTYKGVVPDSVEQLVDLPGIGQATAAAIVAYAYDTRVVFLETNIRAVYLYHYFRQRTNVHDSEILAKIENTLPSRRFRDWYYALTDYGAMLKSSKRFANTQSKHYAKQSVFEGSRRQVRGMILRTALSDGRVTIETLKQVSGRTERELSDILDDMVKEDMIEKEENGWRIKGK